VYDSSHPGRPFFARLSLVLRGSRLLLARK
jgi:hypothetical protein